jgi:hypothetical protein
MTIGRRLFTGWLILPPSVAPTTPMHRVGFTPPQTCVDP